MGPGNHTAYTPHCLRRDFSPEVFSATLNQSVQDWTLTAPDFWHVDRWIQGLGLSVDGLRTHAGGHLGVGGQIGEVCVVPLCRKTCIFPVTRYAQGQSVDEFFFCLWCRYRTCTLRPEIRSSTSTTEAWTGCGGDGSRQVSLGANFHGSIFIIFVCTRRDISGPCKAAGAGVMTSRELIQEPWLHRLASKEHEHRRPRHRIRVPIQLFWRCAIREHHPRNSAPLRGTRQHHSDC